MSFKLNDDGVLVGEDGSPLEINGQPVKVEGAVPQEKVNKVVQERLARQKGELDEQIKALEAQADRTPELERLLQESRDQRAELEKRAEAAKREAEQEVAQQITQYRTESEKLKEQLARERQARIHEQVATSILGNAQDGWINPAQDLVPKLLQLHKREPVKDEAGNPTEQFLDTFTVTYADEEGTSKTEALPVADAVKVLASQPEFQHYLKANGKSGSGGGAEFRHRPNLKRSDMTAKDKSDFIEKHGPEAYKALKE